MSVFRQNWGDRAFRIFDQSIDAGMEFLGSPRFAIVAIIFLGVFMIGGSLFGIFHHGL